MKIKVNCAFDKMISTEGIIPNPRNPNEHSEKQIELLSKIIKAQGWRLPISVSNQSGFIVRGHARRKAAELLGLKECPVDYQDYETEAEEWADLIADNRIAELATWAYLSLKDILQEIDTGELDMDLTGFDVDEIESLMNYDMSGRPKFDKIIEEFEAEHGSGECKKDQNWFYVEYYGQNELFAKIKKLLGTMMKGEHEIMGDDFYKILRKGLKK